MLQKRLQQASFQRRKRNDDFYTDQEVMFEWAISRTSKRRKSNSSMAHGLKCRAPPLWHQGDNMELKSFVYVIAALMIAAVIFGSSAIIKIVKDIPKYHFLEWAYQRVIIQKQISGDDKK